MTYKFRRREARPFLTIGELIADKHPELWQALQYHLPRDVTGIILAPAELRELYGDYLKMRHLHVSIREIIGAKKRTA